MNNWLPEISCRNSVGRFRAGKHLLVIGASMLIASFTALTAQTGGGGVVYENSLTFGELDVGYQKLFLDADSRVDQDFFGSVMAVSGQTIAIGSKRSDKVYIYEPATEGGWELAQTLEKPVEVDTVQTGSFGNSVDIDGNTLVVGAPDQRYESGSFMSSLYVYSRQNDGNWVNTARLFVSEEGSYSRVGENVSINGDIIMAKGFQITHNQWPRLSHTGVYVFERDVAGEWVEQDQLFAQRSESDGSSFGDSIGISGNVALIGDNVGYDDDELLSGFVLVYEKQIDGTWERRTKLVPSDGTFRHDFGVSLDFRGNIAVIGAMMGDTFGGGKAYVFERQADGAWNERQILEPFGNLPESPRFVYFFGRSVAMAGDSILVGAPEFDPPGDGLGLDEGRAFLYVQDDQGDFQPEISIYPPRGEEENFGAYMAMTEDVALVALHWDDLGDSNSYSGSAYAFDMSDIIIPAEISVSYAGEVISNGDSSPSAAQGTSFGSQDIESGSVSRIFRVSNIGGTSLSLGTATSSSAEFIVSGLDNSIAAGSYDEFTVTFDPSSSGAKTATISFGTNDSDEDPFNFDVSGVGSEELETSWLSGAQDLGGDWRWLPWLRGFNISQDPWIFHPQHGWLYPFGDDPATGMFFWDARQASFLYTTSGFYPTMYRFSDSKWIRYQLGSSNPRWFVDLQTGLWESLE